MADGELVRQVLAGQLSAREELARVWSPRVLAMCRARVRASAAEDLAQDCLIKAFEALRQLSEPERFGGWLRSIVAHQCADWHRRQLQPGRQQSLGAPASSSVAATETSPDGEIEVREERESLWAAIEELPQELKEVLLLFYCDNLNYDAIAEWLDVSRSTVNSRLAKARELVRWQMTNPTERDRGLCQRS